MAEKSLNLTFLGEFEGPFLKQSSCCHTCLLPLGARPNDVMSWRRARDCMTSSTHVVDRSTSVVVDLYLSLSSSELQIPGKMVYVRIRLRFDSSPLNYAKKCWFVFDADQCSLVKDVAYLIARQFGLTRGIQVRFYSDSSSNLQAML